MSRMLFVCLFIIGFIFVINLAVILPNNPFEIVPSLCIFTVDKPMWVNYLIILSSLYFVLVYKIYNSLFN